MKLLSAFLAYYGLSADAGTIHATARFLGAWVSELVLVRH